MAMINSKIVFLFFLMVVIISHNCNGLKNIDNFKSYVSYVNEKKFSICLLQETFWNDNFVESISHLYDGKIFCSNSDTNRQGVAILVSNFFKDKVKLINKDEHGRFLHITYEEKDKIFNMINLYAPNDYRERTIFFNFVKDYISGLENIIIGGDFNTSLSHLDKCNKTGHVEDSAYNTLLNTIDENDLYDVWRFRNTNVKQYSFKRISNSMLQQSRIDYFLISHSLSVNVQNVYYNYTSMSDHNFVILNFYVDRVERGPGLWILNNTLLSDDEYVNNVRKIIEEQKLCPLYVSDILVWWDNLKYKIKKYSQVFSMRKAREKSREHFYLQNKFQRLSKDYAEGKKIDITIFENLKAELKEHENRICKGAILRSKANWAVDADCNSKYFLNLEKHRQENNSIKELLCNDDKIVTDTDSILDEQYKFYSNLYSCVEIDQNKMHELLDFNDKKVDEDDIEICDGEVCEEEIRKAIWEMANNKSPGSDGLTVEFYRHFYTFLQEILMKIFSTVHEKKILSRSMRSGILSLIYKKKGDRRLLKNYRPISLLQVDYKIIARVMANRFKTVLPKLVSENQSCCVLGRDIADTICNIRDIIDMVEKDDLECYILKFDQEKAFDRVSHEYLIATLKKFGFGDNFVTWIEIFYTDICSSVKCNGFLTNYFKIKNGIRQGCPISALLYVLAAESLQNAIQKNDKIKGINIPGSNRVGLAFQHADDTTLTVADRESINEAFSVFELYAAGSGAKINREKSEIMCIGKGFLSSNDYDLFGVKECIDVIQILGVYVGRDLNKCIQMNWTEKVKKIKCILNMWLQRHLTIQGRCTVISSLLMSRLWYTLSVFTIPEWVIKEVKNCCINFLWKNGSILLKYRTIVGDKIHGGLKFEDIYIKMLSFRLKFLSRFLNPSYSVLWKDTCKLFLQKLYAMNLDFETLFLDYDEKSLNILPPFYKEMIQSWQNIRKYTDIDLCSDMVYRQPLFCNQHVKINDKPILWKHFINSGIVCLKDIAYEVKTGFLPVSAIVEIIKNCNDDVDEKLIRKQYLQLLSVLPELWKKTVYETPNIKCKECCSEFYVAVIHQKININLCTTKQFYSVLRGIVFEQPNCISFWENYFDESIDFYPIWKMVHLKWKTPDIIELDFKLVHNRIFTNEKLYKIGIVDSPLCTVCREESEDIFHIFFSCRLLQVFHEFMKRIIEKLFENCDSNNMSRVRYEKLIFLGQCQSLKGVNVYFLNFICSLARLCIFKRRNLLTRKNEHLDLIRFFKYMLKHYVSYFHMYCCKMHNHESVFEKYFLKNNSVVLETEDILVFNI